MEIPMKELSLWEHLVGKNEMALMRSDNRFDLVSRLQFSQIAKGINLKDDQSAFFGD